MSRTPIGLFNKSAYRVAVTQTTDSSGGLVNTETTSETAFMCSLQSTGSSDELRYQREFGVQAMTLFAPTGTTLAVKDRVVVDSVKYTVLGYGQDEAGRASFLKFFVNRESPV